MSLLLSKALIFPSLEGLETTPLSSSSSPSAFLSGTCHSSLLCSHHSLSNRCRADPQNRNKSQFLLSWTLNFCLRWFFPNLKISQKCSLLFATVLVSLLSAHCFFSYLSTHCLTAWVGGCIHKFLSCYDNLSCIPRASLYSSFTNPKNIWACLALIVRHISRY